MREHDLICCQIQEWYPKFRGTSIKTIIHELPESFVSYLLEDGLFLSSSSDAMPARTCVTCPQLQSEGYDRWDEEDDSDKEELKAPSFPELENAIKHSIEQLGGSVFPKLNWSAPKDTLWISTTGTLRCQNFSEISLLLKASDRVAHDLENAFDSCSDKTRGKPDVVVLALRKWSELRPEQEFRAFVFRKVLVGICQREVTGFYPGLVGKESEYERAIVQFFREHVGEQFELESYTFDCYVRKDAVVKLLDFNPWGGFTLPLLFSWEELEDSYPRATDEGNLTRVLDSRENVGNVKDGMGKMELTRSENGFHLGNGKEAALEFNYGRVEMRIVLSEGMVQPGLRMGTGIPIDFVEKENWEVVIGKESMLDVNVAAGDVEA